MLVHWCSHYEEKYGGPQKIKTRSITSSRNSASEYTSTKVNLFFEKISVLPCSLLHDVQ